MLNFKSCPRCRGDVNVDRDWYGEYESCLQCGWSKDTSGQPMSSYSKLSIDKLKQEFPDLMRAS